VKRRATKILKTEAQVKKSVEQNVRREWDKLQSALEEEIMKRTVHDVGGQILGMVLYTLYNNYGFRKKRLENFLGELRAGFNLTNGASKEILGREFTLVDVTDFLKEEYEIDVYKEVEEM